MPRDVVFTALSSTLAFMLSYLPDQSCEAAIPATHVSHSARGLTDSAHSRHTRDRLQDGDRYLHFIDSETEAQRHLIACLRMEVHTE